VRGRPTLLIDADDTLWENNVHFLEVTEHLLTALERFNVDRDEARARLIETEAINIGLHGYGSRSFALSVVETFQSLCPQEDGGTAERLRSAAYAIFERDTLELREGAEEALKQLSRSHRLILVTKGDSEEQERKVECSGLRQYFDRVEIVPEKDVSVYRDIVRRLRLDPSCTWMIGNSPRSDINPALAAGLNAILVPHPQTWELELEDIDAADGRLEVFSSLQEVAEHFEGRSAR
jgi:putative hydrolase of the HAD superfamily